MATEAPELTQRGREAMALFAAGASADEIAESLLGDFGRALGVRPPRVAEPAPTPSTQHDPTPARFAGGALGVVFTAFATAVVLVLALTIAADALR
jgi:hypothetical protein